MKKLLQSPRFTVILQSDSLWIPLVWSLLAFLGLQWVLDPSWLAPSAPDLWMGIWYGVWTQAFWVSDFWMIFSQGIALAALLWALQRPLGRMVPSILYAHLFAYVTVLFSAPEALHTMALAPVLGFLWLRLLLRAPEQCEQGAVGKWSVVMLTLMLASWELERRGMILGTTTPWATGLGMGSIAGIMAALVFRLSTWVWRFRAKPIPLWMIWSPVVVLLLGWAYGVSAPRGEYGTLWRLDRGEMSPEIQAWIQQHIETPQSGIGFELKYRALIEDRIPGYSRTQIAQSVLADTSSSWMVKRLKDLILLGEVPGYGLNHRALLLQVKNRSPEGQSLEDDNLRAMIYCGSRDSNLWWKSKGLELSTRINGETQWREPSLMDTHAACLMAHGDREQALFWMNRALVLLHQQQTPNFWAKSEALKSLEMNLARLNQGQPILYPGNLP
jgi:hypothetical protein